MYSSLPGSPPFPYTTLFRSHAPHRRRELTPQTPRDGAAMPLVEVTQEHARSHEPRRVADETSGIELSVPLGERQPRSEEHTSELQSHSDLVCRLLPEKKKIN